MTAKATTRKNPLPLAMVEAIQSQLGYKLGSEGLKRAAKVYKLNPGKGWFERCVKAVKASGGAADPKAVCGAQQARRGNKGTRRNPFWDRTTYSAATGQTRRVSKDRKEEAKLRAQERKEAERIRKAEVAEAKRDKAEAQRTAAREKAEARKDRDAQHRMEVRERAAAKREAAKEKKSEKKSSGGFPSLFGTPYDRLSPSQQSLVRRAVSNKGKTKGRKNPARKNPEDAAAARYEYFHGHAPTTDIDIARTVHEHTVLSGIGKLVKLEILAVDRKTKVELAFKGTLLAQNEQGTQLFIEGGDQSVNVKDFGITDKHEWEVLGDATRVWYDTTKTHLRPEDGGKAVYNHKFGGKKSRLPVIVYDVRNKQLFFAGGGYTLPDVGIDG